MILVDTHCHLDFSDYKDDLDKVIKRANENGVKKLIVPGANLESSIKAIGLTRKYGSVYASVGIHPHDADNVTSVDIFKVRELALSGEKTVAIGEIGLDKFKGLSSIENQIYLFKEQLKIAKELDMPVILHNREANEEFLDILSEMGPFSAGGVCHCFSADERILKELLSMGFHISFTGSITFNKASDLRELLRKVPIERLLLETDSPYMAPVPVRGKRNEPVNVKYLLKLYADNYHVDELDIARVTTHNANYLFKLGINEYPVIAYPIRDSLYLNITNRCTNRCSFCTRQYSNFVMGHNLKLNSEPRFEDIISSMGDISKYKEIVFCGYGEPTLRLDAVKKVAAYVKQNGGMVRLTTNGQGNIINGRNIVPELKGLIDKVAVSLNAPDAETYDEICRPLSGDGSYSSLRSFLEGCKREGIVTIITCLDILGEKGVDGCQRIAEDLGAEFRLRHLDIGWLDY